MKPIIIATLFGALLVSSAIVLSQKSSNAIVVAQANNVTIVDGKQIVSITAKGGYLPRLSKAKADIPTTLRMTTDGTFDCSSALTLPSINYQENLPQSGVTTIEIPAQKSGTKFEGLCSMGMQRFEITFE